MGYQQTANFNNALNINPVVIGISGSNGSGKDTILNVLAEKFGFLSVNLGDMLGVELKRRGLAIERENKRDLSAEWRREGGLGVLVDKAYEEFNQSPPGIHKGLVVGSLRNPGEVDAVHNLNGKVIWVDADSKVRYERITSVKREGREAEDNKTYDEFLAEEKAEMSHSGDESTLNMAAVKEKADFTLENDGDDIEQFKQQVTQFLIDELNIQTIA